MFSSVNLTFNSMSAAYHNLKETATGKVNQVNQFIQSDGFQSIKEGVLSTATLKATTLSYLFYKMNQDVNSFCDDYNCADASLTYAKIMAYPFLALIPIGIMVGKIGKLYAERRKAIDEQETQTFGEKAAEEDQQKLQAFYDNSKPPALILTTTHDHNSAFRLCSSPLDDNMAIFHEIAKDHSIIPARTFESVTINRQIDELFAKNTPADLLILRMHGSPTGIRSSENEIIKSSPCCLSTNDFDVRAIHYSKLAPDATIVLDACSTGKDPSEETDITTFPSLAEWVQVYAGPNRKVVAALKNTTEESLSRNEEGKISFIEDNTDITAPINYESALKKVKTFLKYRSEHLSLLSEHVQSVEESYLKST